MGNNKEGFELALLAYLSLVAEGVGRVTQPMVQQRVGVVEFLAKTCGWPLCRVFVEPLCEAHARGATIDPNFIINLRMGGQLRLGVAVPTDIGEQKSLLPRPLAAPPCLASRSVLTTECQEDFAAMEQCFGCVANPLKAAPKPGSLVISPTASRLQLRLGAYVEAAAQIVKFFGTELWSNVKESQLTSSVQKMAGCQTEASNSGDGHSASLAQTWHAGLASGKTFLAKYREYIKAQQRFQRLGEIVDSLSEFYVFLTLSAEVTPFPIFALLWHRAKIYEGLHKEKALANTIVEVLKNGMATTLMDVENLPSGSSSLFSADAWLQSNLLRATCDIIKDGDMKDCPELFTRIADDLKGALLALQGAPQIPTSCAQALADFKSMGVLVSAAIEPCPVRPSQMAQALKSLDDKRLSAFRAEILESACGKHIIGAATMMMQISSKDTAGDDKLSLAMKGLSDCRLASLSMASATDGMTGKAVLNNFCVVNDMTMAEALSESLSYVVEAEGLWTEGRSAEKEHDLLEWGNTFMSHMRVIDDGCSLMLDALATRENISGLLGVEGAPAPNASDAMADEATAPTFNKIAMILEESLIDEEPFENLAHKFKKFLLAKRAMSAEAVATFEEHADQVQKSILVNIEVRSNLTSVIFLLSELGPPPRSPVDALSEWRAKSASGKAQASFVVNAIRLQELRNQLKNEELVIGMSGVDDGEVTLAWGGARMLTCRWWAHSLAQLSCNHP